MRTGNKEREQGRRSGASRPRPLFLGFSHGGVPEWLKGAVCKIAGVRLRRFESYPRHQLASWTLEVRRLELGSSLTRFQHGSRAHIAQSVEHALGKGEVVGSNPTVGSRLKEV